MLVKNKESFLEKSFLPCMIVLLVIQLCAAFYFCSQKQGYHYDEYYSYYSSNVTHALVPTDMEWKDTAEIRSEFMVLEDAGPGYGMVKLMQSLDVHPPLYYYLLHTVCVLTKGVFSKWQGLSVNLVFFVLSWLTMAAITKEITGNNKKKIQAVCALFGFSPAVFSGITFIRMYMMLTFECLLLLYVHVRAVMREKRTFAGFYLPVMLLSFLGFHTHYYFAVFLFFVAATTCLYLFFKKETRKEAFCYAASVVLGLLLSVIAYTACLSHIFRGYRGTQAQDAFFDITNIPQRLLFFFDLTNEYAFGNMLPLLLLAVILPGLTKKAVSSYGLSRKMQQDSAKEKKPAKDAAVLEKSPWSCERTAITLIGITTVGYFLVVAKTALLTAEEAIRYEMPVYGPLILLVVLLLDSQLSYFKTEKNKKYLAGVFACLIGLTLLGEIYGLAQRKVCFLYPEDKANVAWAKEHASETVAYIYNTTNQWMIWDDSEELMQYDEIYFVSSDHDTVVPDTQLSEADRVYVYKMRGDGADKVFEELAEENGGFREIQLIRELLYCDLYELKR